MRILLLFALIICSSCGYRFQDEEGGFTEHQTISVPFVEGDWDGSLTSAIIEEIGRNGLYSYQRDGGAFLLKVSLCDLDDKNIGFRYDRDRKGHRRHTLIPTETRLVATAEVTLVESGSQKALLGPVLLSANVDFDHDYESPLNSVNIFSLGQLNDYDDAYEAAMRPLYRALAQKIVDFIADNW